MQPATRSFLTPLPLRAATSRMVSIDSCLASSMKAQVLTITVSASSMFWTIELPCRRSSPSMTSESTRFLAQPREIIPTRRGWEGSDIGLAILPDPSRAAFSGGSRLAAAGGLLRPGRQDLHQHPQDAERQQQDEDRRQQPLPGRKAHL